MPTSLFGLILFVALLTPGFAFLVARERRIPTVDRSALRETAQIVLASTAFDAVALGVLGLARLVAPNATLDVGQLIRTPGDYAQQHYLKVVVWCGLALLVATALGIIVGAPPRRGLSRRVLDRTPLRSMVARLDQQPIEHVSAWSKLFKRVPGTFVSVSCELLDDAVLEGLLVTASTAVEENDDRALGLGGPVRMRRDGEWCELGGEIMIGAGQIKFLQVGYWDSIEEWRSSWRR